MVVSQVAVVIPVEHVIANTLPPQDAPFILGDVEWRTDPETLITYAYNAGSVENGLTYTLIQTDQDGRVITLSVYQPLSPGMSYPASRDLEEFKDGELCVSRVEDGKILYYSVYALSIGVPVHFIGPLLVEIDRADTPNVAAYTLRLSSAIPNLKLGKVEAVVSNFRSGSAYVSADFTAHQTDLQYWDIPLPAGVTFDPFVQWLDLVVEIPEDVYAAITAERRLNERTGRPF